MPGLPARGGDLGRDLGQRAAVVEVPVREEDHLDGREIDAEPRCVLTPDRRGGTDVEEHRVLLAPESSRDEHREAVARDAEVRVGLVTAVAVLGGACGGDATEVAGHLGDLRDALVDAREGVRLVVDDDEEA